MRSFALAVLLRSAALCQPPSGQAGETDPAGPPSDEKPAISSVVPAGIPYQPMTARQRWRLYVHETYLAPHDYFRAPVAGLVDMAKDRPPEWRQGMGGYAQRAASAAGRYTLRDTYEAASAAAIGYEVRYVRCRCSGVGARLGYALASSVFTRNRNGRIVPAAPRIGSEFAAEYTARLWLPASYQSDSRIARGVLFQTGIRSLVNVYREFAPELKLRFHKR